jgi:hypothetical protein
VDERKAWMAQNTERLDQLEAEVLALAGIDEDHKDDPRYQLRLDEIRQELATLERLSKLLEDQA